MSIRIVTDSSCDLAPDVVSRAGVAVVPLYINVGAKSYLDGVDLSRQQFYAGLPHFSPHPTTSVPGIGSFVEVYRRLAGEGATAILSIHIAGSLSAIAGVARLAAEEVADVPVTVFDSGQLTLGMGLLVQAAARAAEQGRSLSQIVSLLEDQAARTHTFAALDTLEFLRRSGRLTSLQFGLGSLLRLRPLIMMHRGKMALERVRTNNGATHRLIEHVRALGALETLALVHTGAPDKAQALRHRVSDLFPMGQEPMSAEVTPVIGAHVGPGAVGLVAVQAGPQPADSIHTGGN